MRQPTGYVAESRDIDWWRCGVQTALAILIVFPLRNWAHLRAFSFELRPFEFGRLWARCIATVQSGATFTFAPGFGLPRDLWQNAEP
ncbi:MAG: hypothetical protein QM784_23700 [Polyangiaceae bacterium]